MFVTFGEILKYFYLVLICTIVTRLSLNFLVYHACMCVKELKYFYDHSVICKNLSQNTILFDLSLFGLIPFLYYQTPNRLGA